MENLSSHAGSGKQEPTDIEVITLQESARLIELEKVVTAGLQSWIEVGEALIEIRDSRLYRVDAGTFEEYVVNKFKMERRHAYRLMSGSSVARALSPIGHIPESVVREIAKVTPELRQEIFDKSTEISGHVPTARVIKQVVEMGEEKSDQNDQSFSTAEIVAKKTGSSPRKSTSIYNHKVTYDIHGKILSIEESSEAIGSSPKATVTVWISNENALLFCGAKPLKLSSLVDKAKKEIRRNKEAGR
jgi:hypothetical protein